MANNNETDPSQPLKSTLQEKYIWNLVSGMTQAEAYRQAGYSENGANALASRLIANDGVKARLRYIQAKIAENAKVTQEGQSKKLANVQALCLANGEHSTYVKACEVQNRLYGLDKQVIEQTDAQRQLTATQAAEARRIAEIRVREVAGMEPSKVSENATEEPEYAVDWTELRTMKPLPLDTQVVNGKELTAD